MSAPPDSDHHPSSLRNRDPILEQLQLLLPPASGLTGLALEVASGTGAHLEFFAPAFPSLTFQPSEYVPDEAAPEDEQWSRHGKIGNRAGRDELACLDSHGCKRFTNVLPAVPLDLSVPWAAWPKAVTENEGRFVLMLCSNTLHISPWECTLGFMSGGGKALATGGHLFIYGPFKVGGKFIGDDGGAGNAQFDQKLRETNSAWAIRDVEQVGEAAAAHGLKLTDQVGMPANNLLLHFVKEIVAIRDVEQVGEAAAAHGLKLTDQVGMPANNLLLHFVKEIVAIRDVEQVGEAAAAHGLKLTDQVGMPANKLLLHFV